MLPFARSGVLIGRRRVPVLLLLVALLAGCTANPAVVTTPTPTDAQPAATVSAEPPTTAPSPAPATAAPPTRPPCPPTGPPTAPPPTGPPTGPTGTPGPLIVAWARAAGDPGFGAVGEMRASATLGGRFVVVGYRAIWFSDDGLHWKRADVEDGETGNNIHDVTVGGPGFVAVGDDNTSAIVWTSTDGKCWDRVVDPEFSPGRMWHVGATDVGLVAFGDSFDGGRPRGAIWTSNDGRNWERPTSSTDLEVSKGVRELVGAGGALTAFVRDLFSADATRPIEVWRTRGSAAWAKVGELPGSQGADLRQAAQGPRGWVATGVKGTMVEEGVAWTSADGITWELAPSAPGPVSALLADQAGFLAVGARSTATGCISVGFEFVGQTWTSSDGRVWREMVPKDEWVSEGISQLLRRDQTVFGVGVSWEGSATEAFRTKGVVWTATLPARSVDTRPSPAPTPRVTPAPGCGP